MLAKSTYLGVYLPSICHQLFPNSTIVETWETHPPIPLETGMAVPGVDEESNDNESDSNIINMVSSAIVGGMTFGKCVEEK